MLLNKNNYLLAVCAALISLSGIHLSAQATMPNPEEGTFRLLRVITKIQNFDTNDEIGDIFSNDIMYQSKEGEIKLSYGTRRPSRAYPLPQSKTLELYRWLPIPPNAPEGTKPQKQILSQIPLKHVTKQLVFITTPKDQTTMPISGVSVSDLDEGHLPGQGRLINLSSYTAAMAMEEERVKAEPKSVDTVIHFAPGMTSILVAIEVREGGSWAQSTSNKLRLNDKIKVYALIYDHPPTEEIPLPVRTHIFTEQVREAAPQPGS